MTTTPTPDHWRRFLYLPPPSSCTVLASDIATTPTVYSGASLNAGSDKQTTTSSANGAEPDACLDGKDLCGGAMHGDTPHRSSRPPLN